MSMANPVRWLQKIQIKTTNFMATEEGRGNIAIEDTKVSGC